MLFSRCGLLILSSLLALAVAGRAQPSSPFVPSSGFGAPSNTSGSLLCLDGECQPAITEVTYQGRAAYRITDGRSEAIIVPELGRIMSYGKVEGPNLLWNADSSKKWTPSEWKNYGGDKTWLSPQSSWAVISNKQWPPDSAFDGTPQEASVLTGGKIKLVSGVSKTSGIRLERLIHFNESGELEIQQTAIKTAGTPVRVGLWSVSQSMPAEAVFLQTSPSSPYRDGFFRFETSAPEKLPASVTNGLLCIETRAGTGGQKFGADSPASALASVRDGVAWIQKSAKPAGEYPDGVEKHGFPAEVYVYGDSKTNYVELELLGPLVNMVKGQKMTHTVRWSLHALPSRDFRDPATQTAISTLLAAP